jgi:outer membrane protein OmpA-like peptidoglycan-associated protein
MRKIFKTSSITLMILMFSASIFKSTAQGLEPNEKEALLKIIVTNSKNVPHVGATVIITDSAKNKSYSGITDDKGKIDMLVPKNATYKILYKNYSINVDYGTINMPNTKGMIQFDLTLQYEPAKTYVLKDLLFDTGKSTIQKSSYQCIDDLAALLLNRKTMVVEISGHTDNVGNPVDNMKLSQDRANSVRNYLIKKGIEPTRITAVGYGDTKPVADNSTPQGKQMNRRTEVKIIKE